MGFSRNWPSTKSNWRKASTSFSSFGSWTPSSTICKLLVLLIFFNESRNLSGLEIIDMKPEFEGLWFSWGGRCQWFSIGGWIALVPPVVNWDLFKLDGSSPSLLPLDIIISLDLSLGVFIWEQQMCHQKNTKYVFYGMQGYDFHLVEVIAYKTIEGEAKK